MRPNTFLSHLNERKRGKKKLLQQNSQNKFELIIDFGLEGKRKKTKQPNQNKLWGQIKIERNKQKLTSLSKGLFVHWVCEIKDTKVTECISIGLSKAMENKSQQRYVNY